MFMRPIRVEFDRCGAVQRSGKSSEKGKEAGIDDGGLRNEMYEKFFEQLLLLRTDLFEASESAICARALCVGCGAFRRCRRERVGCGARARKR